MRTKTNAFTVMAVVIAACTMMLSGIPAQAASEFKVGLVVPLTGKMAPFGQSSQAALRSPPNSSTPPAALKAWEAPRSRSSLWTPALIPPPRDRPPSASSPGRRCPE